MIRNTAVTVCGPLNVNKLGVTYVHEHLMVKPQLPDEYYIPYTLDDEAASTEETRSFSAAGGETLVEMTPINYGRNVKAYQRIAQATGVHVICCTGFHKQLFMPPWFGDKTDGELYDILMDEVTNGLDDTEIHPGVIKLGTSFEEVTAAEKRSIEAVARVHRDTGIPISTHCDKGTMGMDQLRLLIRRMCCCATLTARWIRTMPSGFAARALPFAWTMLAENCRIAIPFACGWSRRWWRPAA